MPEVNPLLIAFDEAPFSRIKDEHFKPAFMAALEEARKEITEITQDENPPNFANTVEALEFCGQLLDRISSVFFNLNAANTTETLQALAQEISPLLTEFSNDITLNTDLYERVKVVYDSREQMELNQEQLTLL